MGKTIYSKCQELLSKFSKGDEIGFMKLKQLIVIHIGGQQRTIKQALEVMIISKLIKDVGNAHYKIL